MNCQASLYLQQKHNIHILTLSDRIPVLGYYAHSADPVLMPQNMASDQGLHCLLTAISMQNTMEV